MSENLPLLANIVTGDPISDHHGVRCCPAIQTDSDQKYILKTVSIPASSVQLEALLLSGAYKNRDDALNYYRSLADDAAAEAKLLQKLSRLEGFRSYDAWQTEPKEDGTGYRLTLLSKYGMTLERQLRNGCLTHLAAVNLGLDLCAALSVCRRNGFLYVDLKPQNIFLSETKGWQIGDLGFISLASLKYASLPDKYRSAYTAPEIADAYSALNSTLDIYALGMTLYCVFNGGSLPAPGAELPAPAYADADMAGIILKACAADPQERWQDPQQMGQALVSYMQNHSVNDTPIIPAPAEPEPEPMDEAAAEENEIEEAADSVEQEAAIPADVPTPVEESDEISEESDLIVEDPVEAFPAPAQISAPVPDAEEAVDEEPEQFVIEGFLFDDVPDDVEEYLDDAILSDEVSRMLAQADELIAHQTPDPVIAPEPIAVPIPEPILPQPTPAKEEPPMEQAAPEEINEPVPQEQSQPDAAPVSPQSDPPQPEETEEDADEVPLSRPKKKHSLGWLFGILAAVLVLALLGVGTKYYYENEYLQNITSITVSGAEDWLTVELHTNIDNSLLTVYCTDTYGNKLTSAVEDNRAAFTSLPSGTTYKITVAIDGRHQLTGQTTAAYTTATKTEIVSFTAITGDTDGSVILNFSVQGPDSESWLVKYDAEGEAERTFQCSGHMAVITGLTVGKTYTFRLVPTNELYVVGNTTAEFTACAMIYAQDLTISGFEGGSLIVTWAAPEGAQVDSWTVRCYNGAGTDLTFNVTEPSIAIEGLDITQSYTVDVMASGMTVSKWTSISANSITLKGILIDDSVPGTVTVTWPYEGTVPQGGWKLKCSVDGSESIIDCEKNTCTLDQLIPGATYTFSFVLPEDISVFGGDVTAAYTVASAPMFAGYDVSASDMVVRMCRTPQVNNWTWEDVLETDYTTAFTTGDSASFVLRLTAEYVTSPDIIRVDYIIRNEAGAFVGIQTVEQSWTSLWYKGYCELDLPQLPDAGSYTVEIYFNGCYISQEPIAFTVADPQPTETPAA